MAFLCHLSLVYYGSLLFKGTLYTVQRCIETYICHHFCVSCEHDVSQRQGSQSKAKLPIVLLLPLFQRFKLLRATALSWCCK